MLDVYTSQTTFRQLVDAAAYVGELKSLPLTKQSHLPIPESLYQIACTLLDQEVSFQMLGFDSSAKKWLQAELRSPMTTIEAADFLFVNLHAAAFFSLTELIKAKVGTLIDPQDSCTILVYVEDLLAAEMTLSCEGPGINGIKYIALPACLQELFYLREKMNQEYPLGIDLYITDEKGSLLVIPRTTQLKEVD